MKTAKQVEKERAEYAKRQAELSRLSELLAKIPGPTNASPKDSATATPTNTPRDSVNHSPKSHK